MPKFMSWLLAAALSITPFAGAPSAIAAAPVNTDQWLICDMGGDTIELGDGQNGCCTDEDQDGFIDTCWVCDENHENCVSEELGEDLRSQVPPREQGPVSTPQAPSRFPELSQPPATQFELSPGRPQLAQ